MLQRFLVLVQLLPLGLIAQSSLDQLYLKLDSIHNDSEEISLNGAIITYYDSLDIPKDTSLVRVLNRQAFLSWRSNPEVLDSLSAYALDIATSLGDEYGIANSIYMQGFYHDLAGDFDVALDEYFTALRGMKKLDREGKVAVINEYIGIVYRYKGDYELSLKHYLEALSKYESLQDSSRIGNAYNSLGNLYYDQMDYDRAEYYYRKALPIKRKYGSPNSVANTLGNLSTIYSLKNKYEEALSLALEVLYLKKQVNNLQDLAISYVTAGNIYLQLGELATMDSMVSIGIDLDYQMGNNRALSGDLRVLAHAKRLQGKYAEARDLLREAEKYSIETDAPNNLRSIYHERIMIDTTLGDYRDAFHNMIEVMKLNDTLSNERIAREQGILESNYKFEKEKDSIEYANLQNRLLLETELELQKRTTFYVVFGLILMVIFVAVVYRLYRSKNRANEELTRLNAAIQQQNVAINSQKKELVEAVRTKDQLMSIIAHDLRGPMSVFHGTGVVIKALLEDKDYQSLLSYADQVEERSLQVAQLLDNLLNWALSNGNQLSYHPKSINLYACVSKSVAVFKPLALIKNIAIKIEMDETIVAWVDLDSFDGIVRNLLNNAIKFTPEEGNITVSATSSEKYVSVLFKDSGVGMSQDKIDLIMNHDKVDSSKGTQGEKGTGLGLKLVEDFVRLNRGEMTIESIEGKGTYIQVKIPLAESQMSVSI